MGVLDHVVYSIAGTSVGQVGPENQLGGMSFDFVMVLHVDIKQRPRRCQTQTRWTDIR
jgi:hypothetical protein